jgi:hypothetical protein
MVFGSLSAPDRAPHGEVSASRWAVTLTTLPGLALALAATDIIGTIEDTVAMFLAGMATCGVLGGF